MGYRVSARLVAASALLELSGLALQDTIQQELTENPALEADDIAVCPVCAMPLHGSICPACLRMQKAELVKSVDGVEDDADWSPASQPAGEDDFDPLSLAVDRATLAQRLLSDLAAIVPREDREIAEHLIGSLDEHGYLAGSVEDVADALIVDLARVQAVLSALQTLEPVGVGARDMRECLLIQLDHLSSVGLECPTARAIVSDYLSELGHRKFEQIARLLRVRLALVVEAAEFIRAHLSPHPAQGHSGSEAVAEARSSYIMPDVVIVEDDGVFVVEVIESRRLNLRVGAEYQRLSRQTAGLNEDDRAHVKQYTARARLFISNVEQRRQTIRRITEILVREQVEFLRQGIRALKPLTRSELAARAGLDESTVSRATNGKHVLLPSGAVVSFDTFFMPQLVIHDIMRELLADETRPLTDAGIAHELALRGVHIARRTVAKYRNQLRVLPSSMRPEGHSAAA